MTRRDVALAVALTTVALWLWWAGRQDGGWRGVLTTAGLWWLAALQATWRVWLPAAAVLAGLSLAVPPKPVKTRHGAAERDGTGDGSLMRHPRASLGRVPPASTVDVPPPPLPLPTLWDREGEGVGHGTTDGRGKPPRRNARTGTQHPRWEGAGGAEDVDDDDRPAPRSLPMRVPPADTGVTAKRERSAAVKRAGGGWQARRDAQAAQVLAAFHELGAGTEGGYVDKAAVGQQLGLDTKTVHNRCSDLRAKGLLENPEPGKWRAAAGVTSAAAERVPA